MDLFGCFDAHTLTHLRTAYTMFNVYLPKLLEGRGRAGDGDEIKTLSGNLWDVVIYAVGGCPGAIVRWAPPRLRWVLA